MSKKYLYWKYHENIDQVAKSLLLGRVVVGSSDTVLGLLSNTTPIGFDGLSAIKQRTDKPYIVLIDKIDKLKHFVSIEPVKPVLNLLQICWPGPLTVIFKARPGLPDFLLSHDGNIAIRIPDHAGLLRLLSNFEGLFSTSANLTGEPVPALPAELSPQIMHNVDLVILNDYNLEHNASRILPSTILDCSIDQIKLVRSGAYPLHELEKICGVTILV